MIYIRPYLLWFAIPAVVCHSFRWYYIWDDSGNVVMLQVQTLRTVEVEQQETVKKYMEHRQLMRQTETAMARAALDTRMLQVSGEWGFGPSQRF